MLRKLGRARALDPCHRPEGSWALGTRMTWRDMTSGDKVDAISFPEPMCLLVSTKTGAHDPGLLHQDTELWNNYSRAPCPGADQKHVGSGNEIEGDVDTLHKGIQYALED